MSKLAQEVIIRPIITEESMLGVSMKKYTFKVAKDATKIDIGRAAEQLFDVKVKSVNVINVRGHKRTYGRFSGYTSSWKKAIVTLTEDSKAIEFFDGMY